MEPEHKQSSLAQKLFRIVSVALALCWLFLMLAQPVVEYQFGKGALSILLSVLAKDALICVLVFTGMTLVLSWAGVFPRIPLQIQRGTSYRISGRGLIFAIAFAFACAFILITALLLYPSLASDERLSDLAVNIGPMFLLIGVWVAMMLGVWLDQRRKKRDVK